MVDRIREKKSDERSGRITGGGVRTTDGRADEATREAAYQYIITAAGLPEQSIDLDKLAAALEVVDADIDWLTELGSTPDGLQRLWGVGGLIIAFNMLKPKIAVAQDPKLGMARLLPKVVEDITKRIDGILPQMADIYNAEEKVAEFLESGAVDEQEVLTAMAVLRLMKPDDDDLRANVPKGEGDYFDLFPEVAARFGVAPDDLDRIVYDITGGGAGVLAEAAGFGHLTGVGGPPSPPYEGPARSTASPFIGVPAGHRITRQDQAASDRAIRRAQGIPDQITPRYLNGDEWDPSTLSTNQIRRQQKRLERAGLLEPGSYTAGFWDKASADALFEAMAYANVQGSQVESVISELVELQPPPQVEKFVPPPEVKPDPAAITQDVKRAFRSQLGRDPTDEELGGFAGYLRGQYSAAYDELVAQERALFDAETAEGPPDDEAASDRAIRRARGLPDVADRTVGPFTEVDPAARFRERFEARFGPEIDRLAALPETRENMNNVFASLRRMSSLVG